MSSVTNIKYMSACFKLFFHFWKFLIVFTNHTKKLYAECHTIVQQICSSSFSHIDANYDWLQWSENSLSSFKWNVKELKSANNFWTKSNVSRRLSLTCFRQFSSQWTSGNMLEMSADISTIWARRSAMNIWHPYSEPSVVEKRYHFREWLGVCLLVSLLSDYVNQGDKAFMCQWNPKVAVKLWSSW